MDTETTPSLGDNTVTIGSHDDEEGQDDLARSETTFAFKVENISTIKESGKIAESTPFFVRSIAWTIGARTDVEDCNRIVFYLCCNSGSPLYWSCRASGDIRLIHERGGKKFSRKFTKTFCGKDSCFGFYMDWNEVMDPENGYIKDDCVTIEVQVNADAPIGLSLDSSFISVKVILEDAFFGYEGIDLFDPETHEFRIKNSSTLKEFLSTVATTHEFRIKKSSTLKEFLSTVATGLGLPVERLRPWHLAYKNKSLRPYLVEMEDGDRSMVDVTKNCNPWTIFLQLLKPGVAKFDEDQDVLLFFKYYCPRKGCIHYVGHLCLADTTNLNSVLPKLCAMANIPTNSKLILWEEIGPNMLERIFDTKQPLENILESLLGGSVIVFQMDPGERHSFKFATAKDYFKDLSYKVDNIYLSKGSVIIQDNSFQVVVKCCDKNIPNDEGFSLELSQRMNYEQLAEKVAAHLHTDPSQLEFFKGSGDDEPGHPIR